MRENMEGNAFLPQKAEGLDIEPQGRHGIEVAHLCHRNKSLLALPVFKEQGILLAPKATRSE
jgi:hypothetical protein